MEISNAHAVVPKDELLLNDQSVTLLIVAFVNWISSNHGEIFNFYSLTGLDLKQVVRLILRKRPLV